MQLLRQKATLVALALALIFIAAATLLPPDRLKQIMDAGRFGFALIVALVCSIAAWESFRDGAREGGEQVTIAIALLWTVVTLQALWVPAQRDFGLPAWVLALPINALIPYLYMISAAFFLIPIGNRKSTVPARNWQLLFGAGIVGGIAIGLMLGLGISSLG